jgi:hypothetical protein
LLTTTPHTKQCPDGSWRHLPQIGSRFAIEGRRNRSPHREQWGYGVRDLRRHGWHCQGLPLRFATRHGSRAGRGALREHRGKLAHISSVQSTSSSIFARRAIAAWTSPRTPSRTTSPVVALTIITRARDAPRRAGATPAVASIAVPRDFIRLTASPTSECASPRVLDRACRLGAFSTCPLARFGARRKRRALPSRVRTPRLARGRSDRPSRVR